MNDPVTGPIPRETFAKLVAAPHGEAARTIRQYDPLWGKAPGEKVRWKVECTAKQFGTAYVEASSQEEADKLADELDSGEVDWCYDDDGLTIISVEVDARK